MRDTHQFVEIISQLVAEDDDHFVRLDIKSFFMTGTDLELSDSASQVVESPAREDFKCILLFLLQNQYVKCASLPGRL